MPKYLHGNSWILQGKCVATTSKSSSLHLIGDTWHLFMLGFNPEASTKPSSLEQLATRK
uniref:Uncharacterized protein n=1 Tax=Arundo donax TaxID=35708 RepID=A0A0A9BAG4_ARUDO